jgi:uncharacterized protein YciI
MTLFLVLIRYTRPAGELDRLRPAHREFLRRHYDAGRLIVSGPRVDRTGGVVLARGASAGEVAAWFVDDPYARAGAADYEVVEFKVGSHADGFERFLPDS